MFQHDTYVIKQQSHTHEQYELQHGYPTIRIVYVSLAKINLRVLDNVKNRVFNISILSKPLIYALANGCELRSVRILPSIMHFHKLGSHFPS